MIMVLEYMSEYMGMFLAALALLVVQAICDLALPGYMSDIVDTGVLNGNANYIVQIGGKMILITLLSAACMIVTGYLAARIAASTARDMRADVFKRVQTFSNPELDKFSIASLITRTTNDITQIQMLIVMMVRMLFYSAILGVGGAIKAISESRTLSWTIVGAVLALVVLIIILFYMVMPRMRIMQTLVDKVNLISRENLEGMLVIRAFNTQKFEEARFDAANTTLTDTGLFINRAMMMMMPTMMFIMNVTTVLIVWVGAHQIAALADRRRQDDGVHAVCHADYHVVSAALRDVYPYPAGCHRHLDLESLQSLASLPRDVPEAPILLLLTAEPGVPSEPLDALRTRFGRDLRGEVVELGPLTHGALADLTRAVFPHYDEPAIDRLTRRVAADSAGTPLLAIEILHAVSSGLDLQEESGAWPAPFHTLTQTSPGDLPDTVIAAVRVGYRRLSEPAQRALAAAAALGGRVTAERIGRAADIPQATLSTALDELEWQRWLVADGRGYGFVAGIVERIIERDMLTTGQRRRMRGH